MTMLREFAGRLDQYGGVMAAIAKDVRDLQVLSTATSVGERSAPVVGQPPLAVCKCDSWKFQGEFKSLNRW